MVPNRVGGVVAVIVSLLATVLCGATQTQAQSPKCDIVSVGVDTSLAAPDTLETLALRCGEAGGETFFARDTLIRSITVWRHHAETPYGGSLKLWITRVDSTGAPDIGSVLLDGPVQTFPFGDGIHPIKMEWMFDAPFALPGPGEYYFTVQDYCGGHWDLLLNLDNAFAAGSAWRSEETCLSDCRLRQFPDHFATYDLVFTVEFCHDATTPALRHSWGQLKLLYR